MGGELFDFSTGFTAFFDLGFYFLQGFAVHQSLSLGKEVGTQLHMGVTHWIVGNGWSDKITGNQLRPLMDQLVKCMLAVGTGLSPNDGPCSIVYLLSIPADVFPITFHIALLKISGKAVQVLVIR